MAGQRILTLDFLSITQRSSASTTRLLNERKGKPKITLAHKLGATRARHDFDVHVPQRDENLRETKCVKTEGEEVPLFNATSTTSGVGKALKDNPSSFASSG